MTIETNKRLVATFNNHFENSEIDAALSMMADEGLWWVLGKAALFPVTGTKTKKELGNILHDVHASLRGGMRMDVTGMVAEGDQVAAELHAHAVTRTGRIYDNRYHMLYTLREGKITEGREYTDLMNIRDVFDLPTPAPRGVNRQPGNEQVGIDGAASSWPGAAPDVDGGKRVVADFLGHFARSDLDAVLQAMTDDATWWVNGRPDLYPGSGT
jgi:ketosteroid isomerase-like protein